MNSYPYGAFMAAKLQNSLAALQIAASDVTHAYCEERLQETIPGTPPLTDVALHDLLKDMCNLGAIPTLLAHPSSDGTITESAHIMGINRGVFAKRMKKLNIDKPAATPKAVA